MDHGMDLIVWFGDDGSIFGFQLAYVLEDAEHALTWRRSSGFQHERVDDGEGRTGKHKATPILVPDGRFCAAVVADLFRERAGLIDDAVSRFVHGKLRAYPRDGSPQD